MKKEEIVKRLLDEGHIVIACASRILNKKEDYLTDIEDLRTDGNISTDEAIVLINENQTQIGSYPKYTPNTDWTWDPNRPGNPYWEITCSNKFEYPDTQWPGEKENL